MCAPSIQFISLFGTVKRINSVSRRSMFQSAVRCASVPSDVLRLTDLCDDMSTYHTTHAHTHVHQEIIRRKKHQQHQNLSSSSSTLCRCFTHSKVLFFEHFSHSFFFCMSSKMQTFARTEKGQHQHAHTHTHEENDARHERDNRK